MSKARRWDLALARTPGKAGRLLPREFPEPSPGGGARYRQGRRADPRRTREGFATWYRDAGGEPSGSISEEQLRAALNKVFPQPQEPQGPGGPGVRHRSRRQRRHHGAIDGNGVRPANSGLRLMKIRRLSCLRRCDESPVSVLDRYIQREREEEPTLAPAIAPMVRISRAPRCRSKICDAIQSAQSGPGGSRDENLIVECAKSRRETSLEQADQRRG